VKIFLANYRVKRDEAEVDRVVAMKQRWRANMELAEYQKRLQRTKDVVTADQEKVRALEKEEAEAKQAEADAKKQLEEAKPKTAEPK